MRKHATKIIGVSLLLPISIIFLIFRSSAQDLTKVCYFDVGQGDGAMISKGDFQILIDGGPDSKLLEKLPKMMSLQDRKIDIIILSHPHADHIVGINEVLSRYTVGQVYGTGVVAESDQYLKFLNSLKDKNLSLLVPEINSTLNPPPGQIRFLFPGGEYVKQKIDNLNNSSLVLDFCAQQNCFLFTGDLEADRQSDLLANLSKDAVVKVAHHGSKNAYLSPLYDKAQPEFAVISDGLNNQFGHPNQETLTGLNQHNIQISRTDQDGDVCFEIDKSGKLKPAEL